MALYRIEAYKPLTLSLVASQDALQASQSLATGLRLEITNIYAQLALERDLKARREAQAKKDALTTILTVGGAGVVVGIVIGGIIVALIKK